MKHANDEITGASCGDATKKKTGYVYLPASSAARISRRHRKSKIRGWEDEERWVGSKFAACMWIYTEEAWTKRRRIGREQEECLKKRMLSIMICTNWVCAGVFVDRGWVSERTTIQYEEGILCLELSYRINVPCVAQLESMLKNILGREQKIKKVPRSR